MEHTLESCNIIIMKGPTYLVSSCGYNGAIHNIAPILIEHFSSYAMASVLVLGGNFKQLDRDPSAIERFPKEPPREYSSLKEVYQFEGEGANYYWDNKEKAWYYFDDDVIMLKLDGFVIF